MMRLTRQEASFVMGISYRKLGSILRDRGVAIQERGPLRGSVVTMLGITDAMIAEAKRRAAATDWQATIAKCPVCQSLGRPCNEHKGVLTFLPEMEVAAWR